MTAVRKEDGFTIVEVIVAALIVVLLSLGVYGLVNAASRGTYRAQQSQVVNDRLQSEMEKIKQLPYSQVALTSLPAHSTDTANPNYRVNGTSFGLNRDGSGAEPLAYNGGASYDQNQSTVSGGTIDPTPIAFTTGDVSGQIYRYVTWQQDPNCTRCGSPYVKHVVVAITLNTTAAGGTRTYQELQSDVSNPDAQNNGACQTNCGGTGTNANPWTFWLTDTPCNNTTRQPITGHHASHNTRGACSAGLKSGNNPGAPDLMYTQATPLDNNYAPDQQPLYDYSNDVTTPAQNAGLQLLNGPACNSLSSTWSTLPLVPDLFDSGYFKKVHKWVSNPIPNGWNNIVFNGTGALNLWTRSIGGAVEPGKVCVYLFYRHLSILNIPIDTPAVNLDVGNISYFTYSQNPWPTSWTEINIPIHFDLGLGLGLPVGDRLGVAISVDGSGGATGSAGLEFLYDQPSFDSRLQVQTTSLLPF